MVKVEKVFVVVVQVCNDVRLDQVGGGRRMEKNRCVCDINLYWKYNYQVLVKNWIGGCGQKGEIIDDFQFFGLSKEMIDNDFF